VSGIDAHHVLPDRLRFPADRSSDDDAACHGCRPAAHCRAADGVDGAASGVIAGMLLFGEPRYATRLASLALIVAGIFGVQSGR
jgi:hypothetical protein